MDINHVCHSNYLFTHLHLIYLVRIRLPNWAFITTYHSRVVYFNPTFYLIGVLYMPDFHTNLISIPKLIVSLHCIIHFSSSEFIIQGNHTMQAIGTSNLHYGLYLLKFPHEPISHIVITRNFITKHNDHSCNNIINDNTMWHSHLGHPSHETLLHINKIFHLQPYLKPISIFDTCFYAKQKKGSF